MEAVRPRAPAMRVGVDVSVSYHDSEDPGIESWQRELGR